MKDLYFQDFRMHVSTVTDCRKLLKDASQYFFIEELFSKFVVPNYVPGGFLSSFLYKIVMI